LPGVSIPYWSGFNPIGPTRGSPRAALPQVPWRAPFIKVHGPGIWPRWAGFARKWEIWAIGAVSSCFARRAPAIPGPVEARWAPGFRGVTVRAGERSSRDPRRAFAAMRTPQQPRIHRPIGVIRGPGSEVQADIGPGSLRAPPLKTTCKPMSARLRMNFSCPGPRARGGAPRRGAIDAKSGEPLTPSLPLRAGVPRDPGAGSRRLRPLGGRYSIMVHEEGERPFERCRYRARASVCSGPRSDRCAACARAGR